MHTRTDSISWSCQEILISQEWNLVSLFILFQDLHVLKSVLWIPWIWTLRVLDLDLGIWNTLFVWTSWVAFQNAKMSEHVTFYFFISKSAFFGSTLQESLITHFFNNFEGLIYVQKLLKSLDFTFQTNNIWVWFKNPKKSLLFILDGKQISLFLDLEILNQIKCKQTMD